MISETSETIEETCGCLLRNVVLFIKKCSHRSHDYVCLRLFAGTAHQPITAADGLDTG